MKPLFACAVISLFSYNAPALAAELQDIDALQHSLASYLTQNGVGDAVPDIDRRLKLAKCPEAVRFSLRDNIVVSRCDPLGWRFTSRIQLSRAVNEIIIARGQSVLMTARRNGFSVTRRMIADKSGRAGDMIPVRETRRSAPYMAKILDAGRVEIAQ